MGAVSIGVGKESKSSSSQPKEAFVVGIVELMLVVVLKFVVLEGSEDEDECRLAVELESTLVVEEVAVSSQDGVAFATACANELRYCSAALVLYLASPRFASSTPWDRKKARARELPPAVILAICSSVHSSNKVDLTKLR